MVCSVWSIARVKEAIAAPEKIYIFGSFRFFIYLLRRIWNGTEIKEKLRRNPVLRRKSAASAEILGLRLLPRPYWICRNDVVIGTGVVKRAGTSHVH